MEKPRMLQGTFSLNGTWEEVGYIINKLNWPYSARRLSWDALVLQYGAAMQSIDKNTRIEGTLYVDTEIPGVRFVKSIVESEIRSSETKFANYIYIPFKDWNVLKAQANLLGLKISNMY